ncbi:hypothetical protein BT63DRAFT_16506 [Microthyrium microscopicum]|uniref:Uncharacterized protein n=1 Tax=Microthyrium microscopicum TaxID=703497 RepID=A0A6A6UUB8_9PEZI|nr:hypothetical protein BT63DRAFT_16506 [Microthyrium microscopicum]
MEGFNISVDRYNALTGNADDTDSSVTSTSSVIRHRMSSSDSELETSAHGLQSVHYYAQSLRQMSSMPLKKDLEVSSAENSQSSNYLGQRKAQVKPVPRKSANPRLGILFPISELLSNFEKKYLPRFKERVIRQSRVETWAPCIHASEQQIRFRLLSLIIQFVDEIAKSQVVETQEYDTKAIHNCAHQLIRLHGAQLLWDLLPFKNLCLEGAGNGTPCREEVRLQGPRNSKTSNVLIQQTIERCALGANQHYRSMFQRICTTFAELLTSEESLCRISDLIRRLYYDSNRKLSDIKLWTWGSITNPNKTPAVITAKFQTGWSAHQFLRGQFPSAKSLPRLGSVLVLSGSVFHAYATTCSEYVEQYWPQTGSFVLLLIQEVYDQSQRSKSSRLSGDPIRISKTDNRCTVAISLSLDDLLEVTATASQDQIIQIAQQLCWMKAALSTPPIENEPLKYADASLEKITDNSNFQGNNGSEHFSYRIRLGFEDLHPVERNSCWIGLFSGAIIARNFPCPERTTQLGLEISIAILSQLVNAPHAVAFDGGVVMKGFSTMLVPTQRDDDLIQWHLVLSNDRNRGLSYREGLEMCKSRLKVDQFELGHLQETRHFIGWCSHVENLAGHKTEIDYENLSYSGAPQAAPLTSRRTSFARHIIDRNTTNVAFGLRDGVYYFRRGGTFPNIISAAERTPILLYDVGQQRGFLLPASDVLLHLERTRLHRDPRMRRRQIRLIRGRNNAETLLLNEELALSNSRDDSFGNLVARHWSIMEFLQQKLYFDQLGFVNTLSHHALLGFEFNAVADETSPIQLKQTLINRQSGGWLDLCREKNVLVLFADGYGDLLRPKKYEDGTYSVCKRFRSLPIGHHHIATTIQMIVQLYEEAGQRLNRRCLTISGMQWNSTGSLFGACPDRRNPSCRCSRVQQISLPNSPGLFGPGPLENNREGAVIYGFEELANCTAISTQQQETERLYSLSNTQIENVDTVSLSTDSIHSLDDIVGLPPSHFAQENQVPLAPSHYMFNPHGA